MYSQVDPLCIGAASWADTFPGPSLQPQPGQPVALHAVQDWSSPSEFSNDALQPLWPAQIVSQVGQLLLFITGPWYQHLPL